MINIDFLSVKIENIDLRDYPDFCDAFISYAETVDGVPATDAELDALNADSDTLYSLVWKEIS